MIAIAHGRSLAFFQGGVGVAANQLARAFGAEKVFTTAGYALDSFPSFQADAS